MDERCYVGLNSFWKRGKITRDCQFVISCEHRERPLTTLSNKNQLKFTRMICQLRMGVTNATTGAMEPRKFSPGYVQETLQTLEKNGGW